jgi:S-DNA-T family DNA segregation ATPase FtsK/SpoIIIE
VITGLIKSNLPARICFQVADRSNSRVVLDEVGAERLLGKGDLLFLQPNTSTIVRAQGSMPAIRNHADCRRGIEGKYTTTAASRKPIRAQQTPLAAALKRATLYDQAVEIIIREGAAAYRYATGAGIGYGRGARLIDFMAEDGIVGTYNGAQEKY